MRLAKFSFEHIAIPLNSEFLNDYCSRHRFDCALELTLRATMSGLSISVDSKTCLINWAQFTDRERVGFKNWRVRNTTDNVPVSVATRLYSSFETEYLVSTSVTVARVI